MNALPARARLAIRILLAAGSIAPLAGCSSTPPDVLARIGPEVITVDEFVDVARANQERYPADPDSGRRMLLDDMVKRALLIAQAKRENLVSDADLEPVRRALEDQMLSTVLLTSMAPGGVPVSDAEVREFYRRREVQSHAQVIFTHDRVAATNALGEIRRGQPFEEVADRYNMGSGIPRGGDLGFQAPGTLIQPIDDLIREAKIGEIVGPVAAGNDGWVILRVLERKQHPQEPLALQGQTLRDLLGQRKQRLLLARAYRDLKDQYQVKVTDEGAERLFRRYNAPADSMDRSGLVPQPWPLRPDQDKLPLATYDDGKGRRAAFTFGDAVRDLQDPNGQKPDFSQMPSIRQWIEGQVLRRVTVIEARRRHLDQDPAIARQVRERLNNQLLEAIYNREILARTEVTPADVREAYARHARSFIRLDAARVQWVAFLDSASATQVLEHAGHAKSLREAVSMASPGVEVHEEKVSFPTQSPVWNMLSSTFLSMNPGEIRGPFRIGDGWMAIQLVGKDQGIQTFENLPPTMQQALANEALEMKRDERLGAWSDSLRRVLNPEVHYERLRRIPWPVTAARTPGTT